MRKFLEEKPWYFVCCIFSLVSTPIFEWFVMFFFNEEYVKKLLGTTIRLSDIIPWFFFVVIFLICTIIYFYQHKKVERKIVSSDELNTLNQVLFKAVDENEYIESMQAFQYRVKNGQNEKYIKLSYLAGIANERIEINTILQTYFYFSYPMYKKIRTVSGDYNRYIDETDPIQKENYKVAFLNTGNQLCNQLLDTLNCINNENEIKEQHCDMYRVLAKLLPTISGEAIESFLIKKDIELAIIKRKKTGILGALVINDLYIFRNKNSISKSDRIYFVFPYNLKKNIVFLGSIDGSCFQDENENVVENYCKTVVKDICSSNNS